MTGPSPRLDSLLFLRFSAILVVGLMVTPNAAAAPTDVVTWGLVPTHQIPTRIGYLQGVAATDTTVYAFSNNIIASYDRNGTLLATRNTLSDGSFGAHLGDGTVLGDRIYISTSNYPTPLASRSAALAVHDAATLEFITELTPQGSLTGAGGGVSEHGGYLWWPFVHKPCSSCPSQQSVRQVDPVTGTEVASYPISNDSGYYSYQTAGWLTETLFIATNHGGRGHDYSDVYEWTGSGFLHVGTSDYAFWVSSSPTQAVEFGSQGFSPEYEDGELYVWWAGRDFSGNCCPRGDLVRVKAVLDGFGTVGASGEVRPGGPSASATAEASAGGESADAEV